MSNEKNLQSQMRNKIEIKKKGRSWRLGGEGWWPSAQYLPQEAGLEWNRWSWKDQSSLWLRSQGLATSQAGGLEERLWLW